MQKFDKSILNFLRICDALRGLVPFVQFKKREKHTWRSVNFSKIAVWKKTNKFIRKILTTGIQKKQTNCYQHIVGSQAKSSHYIDCTSPRIEYMV